MPDSGDTFVGQLEKGLWAELWNGPGMYPVHELEGRHHAEYMESQ